MHTPSPDILERNLRAIAIASPRAAALLRSTPAAANIDFFTTPENSIGARRATARAQAAGLAPRTGLASSRRPVAEGRAIAESVDIASSPGIVALGFGLGYHVAAVAWKMQRTGVLLCYEPDASLLRAVLERIDHSEWIRSTNVALLVGADEGSAISEAVSGSEGVFTLGTAFVEHPACRTRLGPALDAFASRFTTVLRAVRTTIVTTLVQSEATLRNLLMNADWYVSTPGIADLAGAGAGRPAIVVSAGPSLRRNMDLLAEPGVRDRVVIIAVQTVLKQLLARGIRPHFVTALDHHEISRRFYEGLTESDVEGVTLVAEPRANPAILSSFPGAIRCVQDDWIDDVLGPPATPKGRLPAGATVAHLAYSLARHMGCDPVIMIGQDLGFTDGQYYAAGAAIHTTWAGELNPFRTLEMLEWERIARSRRLLRRLEDVHGRPIYTDEQMGTYLVQFERMFGADAERGLTTIDATEGGVAKRFTRAMPLRDALDQYGHIQSNTATALAAPVKSLNSARIAAARAKLATARHEAFHVERLSAEARDLLGKIIAAYPDERRANDLVRRLEPISRRVAEHRTGLRLAQHINQVGTLNRFRADRAIAMEQGLSAIDRQRRQAERDLENVTRLAEAAARLGALLDHAMDAMDGAPKLTRDQAPEASVEVKGARGARVVAIVPVDPDAGSLGTRRRLGDVAAGGLNALQITLGRLASSERVRTVLLLTHEPERVRALLGDDGRHGALDIRLVHIDAEAMRARRGAIAGARLFSPACWRGGIAGLTIFDELLLPKQMARAMAEHAPEADAALLLGPDWCAIDPDTCDAIVERYAEHPAGSRVTFTQAAPGLAPCLLARSIIDEFAASQDRAGWLATVGASLGYVPIGPQSDPIAKGCCVPVDPSWRDLGTRAILDLPLSRQALLPALASLGEAVIETPTDEIVQMLAERGALAPTAPQHVTLELCTGRLTSGLRAEWTLGRDDAPERAPITVERASEIIRQVLEANHGAAITLGGAGDPVRHPALGEIIGSARSLGAHAIHVRTDLLIEPDEVAAVVGWGASVVGVDLMATARQTYRAVMGLDLFERATACATRACEIARAMRDVGGLSPVWIVPRMTRCHATLAEVEPFYDHWLTVAGACVIDALPRVTREERIEPLPLPAPARARFAREEMLIRCDGQVMPDGASRGSRLALGVIAGRGVRDGAAVSDLFRALWRVRRQSLPPSAPTKRTLLAA